MLSAEMLDFVVTQTMRCGDLRVGLDLIKRSVLLAETAGRKEVCREDVCAAYRHSRHVHLPCRVKTLNAGERRLLRHIAEMSQGDGG
ncbi:origin of replication recognition protein [hydrocarbon metagenome]|uniref:Origin of replication recognition protein n=1 Tax=hydrocarbon metagenome TaxID=938273 RepID=A0A0W8FFT8_9ZZZZ